MKNYAGKKSNSGKFRRRLGRSEIFASKVLICLSRSFRKAKIKRSNLLLSELDY